MAPMHKQQPNARIVPLDDGTLELRYSDSPDGMPYRCWTMSVQEAENLVEWWKRDGMHLGDGNSPVRNLRTGNILISMFAPTLIQVRMFTDSGDIKQVRCSLPREVVEHLAAWMCRQTAGKQEKSMDEGCDP